jgi:Ribonuclease G/E
MFLFFYCISELFRRCVGTVLKYNRKTKTYHIVRTVPKYNRKTKIYHIVRTVLKFNRQTKTNHIVGTVPKYNRKTKTYVPTMWYVFVFLLYFRTVPTM